VGMGIYKIINVVNNKFYVGSAVNFSRRKARHFSELRHGKHNNRWLQASWNKYGEKAFVFVVVEVVQDKATLLEVENRWLKEHVGKKYCYNLGVDATAPMLGFSGESSPTWGRKRTPEELAAQNWRGKKHTFESKKRISAKLKGRHVSTATRAKISQTLSGEGNFWYGKKRPDHGTKVSKAVVVVQPDGTETVYESILKLRETLGLKPPTVNRAVKSELPLTRGPYKGWIFKYAIDTDSKQA
jgi:group I intron endonuclease